MGQLISFSSFEQNVKTLLWNELFLWGWEAGR